MPGGAVAARDRPRMAPSRAAMMASEGRAAFTALGGACSSAAPQVVTALTSALHVTMVAALDIFYEARRKGNDSETVGRARRGCGDRTKRKQSTEYADGFWSKFSLSLTPLFAFNPHWAPWQRSRIGVWMVARLEPPIHLLQRPHFKRKGGGLRPKDASL